MPEQTRSDDPTMPNRASNQEPAEGSRETVQDEGGGITNRPRSQEDANQQRLPKRGDAKEGGHA